MAVPIAEFLASRHGAAIKSEVAHPIFHSEKGRPPQIDFVKKRKKGTGWIAAYETKYQTQDYDQLVRDICRLACLTSKAGKGNVERYLIYACRVSKGKEPLDGRRRLGNGSTSKFDSILPRRREYYEQDFVVDLEGFDEREARPFRNFEKKRSFILSRNLRVNYVGRARSGRFHCLAWRVFLSPGRKPAEQS